MTDHQSNKWTSTSEDGRNQLGIVVWSLIWVLSFLAAQVAIRAGWLEGDLQVAAAIGVVTGLGVLWILSYRRFFRGADELMRAIQLEALAWTVGIGFVAAFSYSLLEEAEMVTESPTTAIPVAMVATYIVAVIVGQRRFS